MSQFTVGCVSYVNAIPLVSRFEDWGDKSPVHVLFDVPSRLPAMLEDGSAQAILVSSIDALRVPGRRMAAGICIGSHGPVKSVRLFSSVPFAEIKTLAFDASSMTSNRLAQVLLADGYNCRPAVVTRAPDLKTMLAEVDACVLIGDIGMSADGSGLHVMDLGEEWRRQTGKPFVWAAWIGDSNLTPLLASYLVCGAETSAAGRKLEMDGWRGWVAKRVIGRENIQALENQLEPTLQKLIDRAMRHAHWNADVVRDYYLNVMVYGMEEEMLEGYREFQRRLLANGFDDCRYFPELVNFDMAALIAEADAA